MHHRTPIMLKYSRWINIEQATINHTEYNQPLYSIISLHIIISFFVYFRDIIMIPIHGLPKCQLGHKQMFKMPVVAATSAYSMIAIYMYIKKKPSLLILRNPPYLATTHPALKADDFKCCTRMQHEWQPIPTYIKSVLVLFYFVLQFLGVFVSSWQVKRCCSLSNFKVSSF